MPRGDSLADRCGQRMQGAIEALISGILMRGLSSTLATVLMAAPSRKTARALLKKIYVLDDRGEMAGEYVLDADCPIDYADFLKVLPPEGIGDRDSLFVGEYVFTAFQSSKFVFVLLSRGHLAPEDVDWTALLLTAADSHLVAAARPAPPRAAEPKPEFDRAAAERETRLAARERSLAEQEAKLRGESANLQGRQEELNRQKAELVALAARSAPPRVAEAKPEVERAAAEREARLAARERSLAEQEAKLRGESANLQGRQQELDRQKAELVALADYSA